MTKQNKQLVAVLTGSISVLPTYLVVTNFRGGEEFFPHLWFGAFGVFVSLIALAVIAVPFDNWLRVRGKANWLWYLVMAVIVAPAVVAAIYFVDGWGLAEVVERVEYRLWDWMIIGLIAIAIFRFVSHLPTSEHRANL